MLYTVTLAALTGSSFCDGFMWPARFSSVFLVSISVLLMGKKKQNIMCMCAVSHKLFIISNKQEAFDSLKH